MQADCAWCIKAQGSLWGVGERKRATLPDGRLLQDVPAQWSLETMLEAALKCWSV